jgi:5-methylthioadenosine/S-adenosylhomocysteine deaminase
MSILIKNCSFVLTQDNNRRILRDYDVFVEDNRISEIGKNLKKTSEFVIDGNGKLLMPGLINCHTHLAMTLFRGVADDLSLMEWLQNHIWPMEKHLTPEVVHIGSLLGCLEMIRTGTTCFADMYFYGKETARAVQESGLRGVLCSGILENLPEELAGLKTGIKFVEYAKDLNSDRIIPSLGPHSMYTCSEQTLREVRRVADEENVRVQIHLAETKSEFVNSNKKYNKTPVEFLNSIGFLKEDVIAAHSVYVNIEDIGILKNKNVRIVHCPVSNMKLASGIAPIPEIMENNLIIGLGTDGATSNNSLDMFDEMKFASLLHKISVNDPTVVPAQKALDFATIDGAKVLGLENEIGSIEEGKKADIILLDMKKPFFTPIFSDHSIVSHLVYSGKDVETVIVNGRVIMKNKKILSLNEEDIMKKFQKVAEELKEKSTKSL